MYSKGNPGCAYEGGVLRDHQGKFILAFSIAFDKATRIQAEARALLFGVKFCLQNGFTLFVVECDSLVLV